MVDRFDGFMQLPIRRRGNFRKDSFFKDFQDDFDSAIENVMDRHSGKSLLADQFSIYRKMRENTEDAGPAASISETTDSTVIVLDMSDFVKGSIAVGTKGRNAIVEANYNSKSFCRKFPLPTNTNFDGVKTAMSNEGILTITAPKKDSGASSVSLNKPSLKLELGEPESIDNASASISGENVGVSFVVNGKAGEEDEEEAEPLSPSIGRDRKLSISQKGNFFQDHYFENVWQDFEKAMEEMVEKEEKRSQDREQRVKEKKELINKLKREMFSDAEKKQRKFFERTRKRDELHEFGLPSLNRINSYRNLRSWAPDSETQAYTISQDKKGYKIVMDVKNFGNSEGDVSVKAAEGLLTITGRKDSMTFKKEFTLKGLTNPDQVHASVSEDGVLTVTVEF